MGGEVFDLLLSMKKSQEKTARKRKEGLSLSTFYRFAANTTKSSERLQAKPGTCICSSCSASVPAGNVGTMDTKSL